MSVDSLSYGAVPQEKRSSGSSSSPVFPLLGTAAGVGIGGLAVGRHMNGFEALTADKFELSEKAQGKLNDEGKAAYENIGKARTELVTTPESLFGDAESVSVDTILNHEGKANIAEVVTQSKEKLKTLKETEGADPKDIARAEAELAENTSLKALADGAKEGQIAKADYIKHLAKTKIADVGKDLEKLGSECPKKFSMGKAGIGAALGLVGGIILAKIFSHPNKEA